VGELTVLDRPVLSVREAARQLRMPPTTLIRRDVTCPGGDGTEKTTARKA
jgi:hypothetical protein